MLQVRPGVRRGAPGRGGKDGVRGQCALTGAEVVACNQFNSCGPGNRGVQIFRHSGSDNNGVQIYCNHGSFTCGADLGRSAVDAKNDVPVQKGVVGRET